MTYTPERTVNDDYPPPSVVGASPWPYPAAVDRRYTGRSSADEARQRVAADRRRSGLVALPPYPTHVRVDPAEAA